MNKRIRLELYSLAMKVNEETSYCVFFEDAAHVRRIYIRIRQSKENFTQEIYDYDFYYDEKLYEHTLSEIQNLKEKLEYYLTNPRTKLYKAEFDLGLTKVSKVFETEEARAEWVEHANKHICKTKIEPTLTIEEQ
jgi:hypothetical protein